MIQPPHRLERWAAGALLACTVGCGPTAKVEQLCDAWVAEAARERAEALVALSRDAAAVSDAEVSCVETRLGEVAATVDYVCGARMRSGESQPRPDSWNVLERAHSLQFGLLQGLRSLFSDPQAQLQVEVDALVRSCRAEVAVSDRSTRTP